MSVDRDDIFLIWMVTITNAWVAVGYLSHRLVPFLIAFAWALAALYVFVTVWREGR